MNNAMLRRCTLMDRLFDVCKMRMWCRYQQMMHVGLAAYIYFKVVRQRTYDLGRGEWKLHVISLALPISTLVLFLPFDAFGCSGYW
jgi:hypothetical protein